MNFDKHNVLNKGVEYIKGIEERISYNACCLKALGLHSYYSKT